MVNRDDGGLLGCLLSTTLFVALLVGSGLLARAITNFFLFRWLLTGVFFTVGGLAIASGMHYLGARFSGK